MQTKIEEFEVVVPSIDGDTVAERVKVKIPLQWDEEVQEWLLTPEAHQIIEDTKARHMGLLLPAQFKELRKRYGYTQQDMGALFQVGEKSWTRWESGNHRPSRSINLLIRALYEGEISINFLLKQAGKPLREAVEKTCHADFLGRVISHWSKAIQFRAVYTPRDGQIESVFVSFGKSDLQNPWDCVLTQQALRKAGRGVWIAPRVNVPVAGPVPRFDPSKFGAKAPSAS